MKIRKSASPRTSKGLAFDRASVAEGAIPVKYREWIAVAVSTQCLYCIDIHGNNERVAGATQAETIETAMVAASFRAGGTVNHVTHLLMN
ncbi:MAG: carboxymuconolactone decarboxylase family protein [Pyrinomonadaceae bacterium]